MPGESGMDAAFLHLQYLQRISLRSPAYPNLEFLCTAADSMPRWAKRKRLLGNCVCVCVYLSIVMFLRCVKYDLVCMNYAWEKRLAFKKKFTSYYLTSQIICFITLKEQNIKNIEDSRKTLKELISSAHTFYVGQQSSAHFASCTLTGYIWVYLKEQK